MRTRTRQINRTGVRGDRQEESIRETPNIKKTKKTTRRKPRVKVVVEAIPTDRVTRNAARVSTYVLCLTILQEKVQQDTHWSTGNALPCLSLIHI